MQSNKTQHLHTSLTFVLLFSAPSVSLCASSASTALSYGTERCRVRSSSLFLPPLYLVSAFGSAARFGAAVSVLNELSRPLMDHPSNDIIHST